MARNAIRPPGRRPNRRIPIYPGALRALMDLARRKVKYSLRWNGTLLTATLEIPTPKGPVRGMLCFDAGQVLRELHQWIHKRLANTEPVVQAKLATGAQEICDHMAGEYLTGDSVESGFFGGLSIKKLMRKIARAKLLKKMLKVARAIQKNPLIAKAVGLTTLVVPGFGAAIAATKAAANIADGVVQGAPAALGKLAQLRKLASQGSDKAKSVLELVKKTATVRAAAGRYGKAAVSKATNLLRNQSTRTRLAARAVHRGTLAAARQGHPGAINAIVRARGGLPRAPQPPQLGGVIAPQSQYQRPGPGFPNQPFAPGVSVRTDASAPVASGFAPPLAMIAPWMLGNLPNVVESIRRDARRQAESATGGLSAQGSALLARQFAAPRVRNGLFSHALS